MYGARKGEFRDWTTGQGVHEIHYYTLDCIYLCYDGCVGLGELPFTLVNITSEILVWIITRWAEFLYERTTNCYTNIIQLPH